MRIVCLSDTHELHERITDVPDGDVLIHAGDFTMDGQPVAILRFVEWFEALPHKHKIVIAGNHDLSFDPDKAHRPSFYKFSCTAFSKAHYLNDSGIEIDGVKFWGSPIQPWFQDWAFNRMRGPEIREHWNLIPEGTDVLITHGPPKWRLDTAHPRGEHLGCEDLAAAVERISPKLHVFGHIHGGAGMAEHGIVKFVNASIVDEAYRVRNEPIVVEI